MYYITQTQAAYNELSLNLIDFCLEYHFTLAKSSRTAQPKSVQAAQEGQSLQDMQDFGAFMPFELESLEFSPEELKAGFEGVKEYLLALNDTQRLFKYLEIASTDKLKEAKAIQLALVNKAFEANVLSVQNEYVPQDEKLTWEAQEKESLAYKNSGYKDESLCVFMKELANLRGMSLKELVDKCLLKSELYRKASAQLIGKRQALQDSIEKAGDLEAVKKIAWEVVK